VGDRAILQGAAFLRTTGVGLTGVVLLLHLSRSGLTDGEALAASALGLAGGALAVLLAGLHADRLGRRRTLVGLSLLSAAGGLLVAVGDAFPVLALGAFVGALNSMGRDRGAASAVEQAILPGTTTDRGRTSVFARYHVVLDAGHGVGALLGALPWLLRTAFDVPVLASYRLTIGALALLGVASALLYARLSPAVEAPAPATRVRLAPSSRRIVTRISALFALDSLGGGFLANAFLAWWFFVRFGIGEEVTGPLLAAGRIANVVSYLAAARLARRIGLVRTMVFTHLPSHLLLLLLPLMPEAGWAAALYLLREFFVEMDLPTRQSYLMAVVLPSERTVAAGIAGVTRVSAWAAGQSLSSVVLSVLPFSAPLVIGAGLKIGYDLLLYAALERHRPPEERPPEERSPPG
jgi:predicted MFS family arabinose efflux permease